MVQSLAHADRFEYQDEEAAKRYAIMHLKLDVCDR